MRNKNKNHIKQCGKQKHKLIITFPEESDDRQEDDGEEGRNDKPDYMSREEEKPHYSSLADEKPDYTSLAPASYPGYPGFPNFQQLATNFPMYRLD